MEKLIEQIDQLQYYNGQLREENYKREIRCEQLKQELEQQRQWVADLLNNLEDAAKNFEDLKYIHENVQDKNIKLIQHNSKLSHYIYYLQDLLTENGIEFEVVSTRCE